MTFPRTLLLGLAASAALASPGMAQSAYTSFALGRTDASSTALALRWHGQPHDRGWSWAAGLWATSDRSAWIGGGVSYTLRPGHSQWFVRGSFMPGLYARGNGVDLGGALEFATGIEVGTDLRNGAQVSLLVEHRSNAGLYASNPGVNTLSVVYSIPLN
ncbi:MAG: acyloxyacyl hydrolase [Rhodobacter sp.]|uniref:acyloxyacyl hydrolase n=1 Tax=Pararhodobacter sp. TaxID=2127056 RepID=UPI001DB727B7|nr:acyloxyacyl hydrolase [Pararhodobacter sp.]MCB1346816.1 acyloxyacyl hydrolase [Paracoccaceae bacterium]MCC0073791.1 acyloxyacyl hydrolase [Rhodobacter sp.]HPD91931.1 acyloxyacyl hydrolase [Pararhodobacter sp.]